MKTISMLDEKDVREEVEHVLSNCYDGDEWMEDGSIRQSIRDLQRLTDNHISVMARHDNKLITIAHSLNAIEKMLKILSEKVGVKDGT